MDTLTLVPSVTDDSWQDEKWVDLRVANNLGTLSSGMLEVTVQKVSSQWYAWVNLEEVHQAGLMPSGLYVGVFTATPYPHPLGLLAEADNNGLTFIPFYYPKEEEI